MPISSTDSEAFTVIVPALPLPPVTAPTTAPSRRINRPVSIFTLPASPSPKLAATKPLPAISSTDSEAFTVTFPAFPSPSEVLASTTAPSRRINRPVLIITLPASPEPRVSTFKLLRFCPSGEVPISSTDSKAFTITFPAFPLPLELATTDAPSRIINRPVSIVTLPASPISEIVKLLAASATLEVEVKI
ncbi:hypothetical protein MiSe_08630 [Microseira wollei NIES-4236]|uniref:Uncharacterized protein n=1 Tax=Microseira wollei NIES-4236 TaxID=2530354 RepID=A0AAV3X7T5_9CYAN|nr:hypothetical protein MiSe_08630 [Microseira wollei NIES-4236]